MHLTPTIEEAKRRFSFTSSTLADDAIDVAWATALTDVTFAPLAQAFAANVVGLLSTIGMPAQFALSSAERSHWQRIYSAERIRALNIEAVPPEGPDTGLEAHRAQAALASARERMAAFVASPEGLQLIADGACRILLDFREDPHMSHAADELLRQGTVLLWGAFEVLARDAFVCILNTHPKAVASLLTHADTKARFGLKAFGVETLAASGFDLSKSMGTILADANDLSDLATIRSVYSVLFPHAIELHQCLNRPSLWRVSQRRHLIVHRRGIVDRRFLELTGEVATIGAPLPVSPSIVEEQVAEVIEAARLAVNTASTTLPAGA